METSVNQIAAYAEGYRCLEDAGLPQDLFRTVWNELECVEPTLLLDESRGDADYDDGGVQEAKWTPLPPQWPVDPIDHALVKVKRAFIDISTVLLLLG